MAKLQKSISLKNCIIDMDVFTVTEYDKDETREYSLESILQEFAGLEGVCISIRQADDLPALDEDEVDDESAPID